MAISLDVIHSLKYIAIRSSCSRVYMLACYRFYSRDRAVGFLSFFWHEKCDMYIGKCMNCGLIKVNLHLLLNIFQSLKGANAC